MHTPVLFKELIQELDVKPSKKYIDATLGEGGFTRAIAQRGGQVLALDWDEDQVQEMMKEHNQRITCATANFAHIASVAKEHGFENGDGIIFDLGLSMKQIHESGRGFSYKKFDEPLDMRINRGTASVSDYINNYSFDDLYDILTRYSEELNSRAIVQSVIRARSVKPINTVGDLVHVINSVIDPKREMSQGKREQVYARVFQAFRIAVNHEFENIRKGLYGALELLDKNGVLIVITFHSLEDRIVKQWARKEGLSMKVVKKKKNVLPFERSARMRVIRGFSL